MSQKALTPMTEDARDNRFDAVAQAYELLVDEPKRWSNEGPLLTRWLDRAGRPGRRRILDLGCGTGFHARYLARHRSADVVGVDPSAAMLEIARSKPGGSLIREWRQGTAEEPNVPGPFDLILLLGNTLSLIVDSVPVFSRIATIIEPTGGLFALQILDYDKRRAGGVKRVERCNENVIITKTLTPRPGGADDGIGAELEIVVRARVGGSDSGSEGPAEQAGDILAEQRHLLIDHRPDTLIEFGRSVGLELDDRRTSYAVDEQTEGPDHILVFRAAGRAVRAGTEVVRK